MNAVSIFALLRGSSTDRKEYSVCVSSELGNNFTQVRLWAQLSGMTALKGVRGKLMEYLHTCRYADIILSLWCASSFVGLVRDDQRGSGRGLVYSVVYYGIAFLQGSSVTVFSQTLFDMSNYLSIDTSSLAPMFAVQAFGYSLGSAASGVCFDRFHHFSFWQLITVVFIGSLGML